jgi:SAM-dependent methyltransferase
MTDYLETFSARAKSYFIASQRHKHVLKEEYIAVLKHISPKNGDKILHIAAAGVNIKDFIDPSLEITWIEVECIPEFARIADISCVNIYNFPFSDEEFDTVVHLASLHHFSPEERQKVYSEVLRILRPGGKYIIGDVEKNTPPDKFLNEFVDSFNPFGHKGMFFDDSDADALLNARFSVISLNRERYYWNFLFKEELDNLCRDLFYLKKFGGTTDELLREIGKYLEVSQGSDDALRWGWQLLFLTAFK